MGNLNPRIEEGPTTKWPKGQQRSTKHTHTVKDRLTPTPLRNGGELVCSRRVK